MIKQASTYLWFLPEGSAVKTQARRIGDVRIECRLWQKKPTLLRMYKTTSPRGLHENSVDLSNFGNDRLLQDSRRKEISIRIAGNISYKSMS